MFNLKLHLLYPNEVMIPDDRLIIDYPYNHIHLRSEGFAAPVTAARSQGPDYIGGVRCRHVVGGTGQLHCFP